jgi:nicotinamidase-related amidase
MAARGWEALVPEEARRIYGKAGFGRRLGFGQQPAVLVVDMQYDQLGDRPEPVLDSVERYPLSAGEVGWAAVKPIRELLEDARQHRVPILYTLIELESGDQSLWKSKVPARRRAVGGRGGEIVDELAPQEEEIVIRKKRSSAFFGTPLLSYLHAFQADTVIVAGCTTGSCVRATVLDASQYNFYPIVVEECVFDRSVVMNAFNLFEMDAKWADVVPLEEVKTYFRTRSGQGSRQGTSPNYAHNSGYS